MRYLVFTALLLLALEVGSQGFAQSTADDVQTLPKSLRKDYTASAPGSMTSAVLSEEQTGQAVPASTVTTIIQVPLRPMPPPSPNTAGTYYYYNGYIPGDYSREGFMTEQNGLQMQSNWWIGNQPYLPYYSYNPPTINGYYPPYAYSNGYQGGYGNNYGYGGFRSSTGIVPAPPLASPPAYIPAFTTPVMPAPLNIRVTGHGIITQRDPHFQLFFVPQPPNYLTTGSAIYQVPQQFYNYNYPPYPYYPY